ncbi:MAG: glycogen synthase GlgA [Gemmatimonadales bacterium]|nr:glycogen synthase GlgA [Gemmatimonadales bacterium]MBA3709206.1 glycogen synthase GlgA [Planctomycetota bacterium]
MPKALRILHVASEMVPLVKTGGLADVSGALPLALKRQGHDARVVIPAYRRAVAEADKLGITWGTVPMTIEVGGIDHSVGVGTVDVHGLTVHLIACNELFDRDGIYGPSPSNDYDDNARRFAVFCKAALALPGYLGWTPHVIHAHDWQAGLIPALLERGYNQVLPGTRTVFSIHNVAYQGSFWHFDMKLTGLDWALFNPMHVEHYGKLNLLKAGIVFADRVVAVSRRYAEEIQMPEYAYGLDAVIKGHSYKLSGITNGIDAGVWNPATDPHLPAKFDKKKLAGKKVCKDKLREECGLVRDRDACVVAVVSRLVEQKGIDILIETVGPYILSGRMQLIVLGSGDLALEARLHQLQARHPGWVYVWYGYNDPLAHRIIAGADAFAMPSRYEPCGLTQMYSMRYGTLPIVRYTGGLADTVVDVASGHGNGFTFGPIDVGHFSSVLDRALGLYQHFPEDWKKAQVRGMTADFSWDHVANEYIALYERITFSG